MEIKKFVKKPVEIEAVQLVGSGGDTAKVLEWINENGYPWLQGDWSSPETLGIATGVFIDPGTGELIIRTLEGDMRASYGDWIIKGIKGEFYPCKPDIFEETYDALPE
jgi:hypothetical protein